MARKPTRNQRRAFDALIKYLTPELARAFQNAVTLLKSEINWKALLINLAEGNVLGAIESLNLTTSAFYEYAQKKIEAYNQGANLAATTIIMPGAGVVGVRFDMRNPAAERWILRNVWGQIDGWMGQEALETLRETILSGYEIGRHPTSIAVDVAGRVVGGQRQGGVIGLDRERARRLTIVSRGMETAEGVQSLVVRGRDGTLSVRYKVNRQTENRILRAYRAGTAVPSSDRAMSVRQYSNALLKARADQLALDSTAEAVMAGRREEWVQTLQKLGYGPEAVQKTWWHGGGPKDPRPHHVDMSGKTVVGLDTPFEFSNGAQLQFPHDPDGEVSETTNCTCGCDFRLVPSHGLS